MDYKYFIKVENEKIVGTYSGPNNNTIQEESLIKEGYIEIPYEQSIYLNSMKPLKYVNGEVLVDEEQVLKDSQLEELYNQYNFIYSQLQSTDYITCKIVEGVATKEDYQDILDQRVEWRKQINELQKEIDKLK